MFPKPIGPLFANFLEICFFWLYSVYFCECFGINIDLLGSSLHRLWYESLYIGKSHISNFSKIERIKLRTQLVHMSPVGWCWWGAKPLIKYLYCWICPSAPPSLAMLFFEHPSSDCGDCGMCELLSVADMCQCSPSFPASRSPVVNSSPVCPTWTSRQLLILS